MTSAFPQGYAPAPSYPDAPAQYNYNYKVEDADSSNNYGAQENRDGQATSGSYYVSLPDGRLQKVTYTVNGEGGYVAEVTYEGEAQYPEETKSYSSPPANSYSG